MRGEQTLEVSSFDSNANVDKMEAIELFHLVKIFNCGEALPVRANFLQ